MGLLLAAFLQGKMGGNLSIKEQLSGLDLSCDLVILFAGSSFQTLRFWTLEVVLIVWPSAIQI